jgi:hypothetical protein
VTLRVPLRARRAWSCLAVMLAAVAFGLWLRQGILTAPVSGAAVKWSAGRTRPGAPWMVRFHKLVIPSADPSLPARPQGWVVIIGGFYLARSDTGVSLR